MASELAAKYSAVSRTADSPEEAIAAFKELYLDLQSPGRSQLAPAVLSTIGITFLGAYLTCPVPELVDMGVSIFGNLLEGNRGLEALRTHDVQSILMIILSPSSSFPASVKAQAVRQAGRLHKKSSDLTILSESGLLATLLRCLGDKELSVAEASSHSILEIAKLREGLLFLSAPSNVQILRQIASSSSDIAFRVFALLMDIFPFSEHARTFVEDTGILQSEVTALAISSSASDPLLFVNALDALTRMATTDPHLLELCILSPSAAVSSASSSSSSSSSSSNLLSSLYSILAEKSPSIDTSVVCGILHFAGDVASRGGKAFEAVAASGLLQQIHAHLILQPSADRPRLDSVQMQEAALTSSFAVVSCSEGLSYALHPSSASASLLADDMCSFFVAASPQERKMTMDAISHLLELGRVDSDQSTPLPDPLLQRFIQGPLTATLEPNPLSTRLMANATSPFAEIRLSAYRLCAAMMLRPWSARLLLENPDFLTQLCERQTEGTKEGKEWRYILMQRLVATADAYEDVLDEESRRLVGEYVARGAFYIKSEAAVLTATRRE